MNTNKNSALAAERETALPQAVITVLMFVSALVTVFFVGIDHPAASLFAFGPTVLAVAFFVWRDRRRLKARIALQGSDKK